MGGKHTQEPRTMECPACQGDGKVEVAVADTRYNCLGFHDPNCYVYEGEVECPVCLGGGYVDEYNPSWNDAMKIKAMRDAGKDADADESVHSMAVEYLDRLTEYDPVV